MKTEIKRRNQDGSNENVVKRGKPSALDASFTTAYSRTKREAGISVDALAAGFVGLACEGTATSARVWEAKEDAHLRDDEERCRPWKQ